MSFENNILKSHVPALKSGPFFFESNRPFKDLRRPTESLMYMGHLKKICNLFKTSIGLLIEVFKTEQIFLRCPTHIRLSVGLLLIDNYWGIVYYLKAFGRFSI